MTEPAFTSERNIARPWKNEPDVAAYAPGEPEPFTADQLRSLLTRASAALAEFRAGVGEVTDPNELADLLLELRQLKEDVRGDFDLVQQLLISEMQDKGLKKMDLPGAGVIEVRKSTKRTGWKWSDLVARLVARKADDWQDEPPAVWAAVVAEEITQVIAPAYARIGALKARNLRAADFCDETPDGFSLQLPKRGEEF